MASLPGNQQSKGAAGFPPTVIGTVYNVSNVSQLTAAVSQINAGNGSPSVIILSDGVYQVPADIVLTAGNTSIQSASANRGNCIIQGDAMSATAVVGDVIHFYQGTGYTIQNVTVRQCGWSGIQIHGENGVSGFNIINCVVMDTYQHMIKISDNGTYLSSPLVTNGLVKNCLIGYTAAAAPNNYTGGVDAHRSNNVEVVGNTFQNIASPATLLAEASVHFWRGSSSCLVHKNKFINCDRNIGFGLFGDSPADNCTARNNMIYHSANGAPFADVSIAVESSVGCQVGNNSIYRTDGYPNAVEYRGVTTGTVIANNLTNKAITARDGGTATLQTNNTAAQTSSFVNPAAADLHLNSAVAGVVNAGTTLPWVPDDFDGTARPIGTNYDIGADEFA